MLFFCVLKGFAAGWANQCIGFTINTKHRGCSSEIKETTKAASYYGLSKRQTYSEDCWCGLPPDELSEAKHPMAQRFFELSS